MKHGSIAVTGIALAALAAPAAAQDGSWSGVYVGAEAGGAGSRVRATSTDSIIQVTNINPPGPQPLTVVPGTSRTLDRQETHTNFSYGGFVGAQLQRGRLVFGIEGGIEGPRDTGTVTQTNALPPTLLSPASTVVQQRGAELDYSWWARAKVGVSLGDTLLYAAGGATGARIDLSAADTYTIPAGAAAASGNNAGAVGPAIGPNVTTASARRSLTGWTAGIGGEHRLSRHLTLGLDARYSDYGAKTFDFANVTTTRSGATTYPGAEGFSATLVPPDNDIRATPGSTRVRLDEWRLSARLSFRF